MHVLIIFRHSSFNEKCTGGEVAHKFDIVLFWKIIENNRKSSETFSINRKKYRAQIGEVSIYANLLKRTSTRTSTNFSKECFCKNFPKFSE